MKNYGIFIMGMCLWGILKESYEDTMGIREKSNVLIITIIGMDKF